jgi:hypothetical protein
LWFLIRVAVVSSVPIHWATSLATAARIALFVRKETGMGKIPFVDDDMAMQLTVARILGDAGHVVELAKRAQRAWHFTAPHRPKW